MKAGKVSESVLKRSVLKELKFHRNEIVCGADPGEDCAVLSLAEGEELVSSMDPITATGKDIGKLAVYTASNDVASFGAEPIALMVTALFPVKTTEDVIKEVMHQVAVTSASLKMQVIGGHTEVTSAVHRPVLTVTAFGKKDKNRNFRSLTARPGQDVLVSKWVGLEGTVILAKEKEEELKSRLPASYIHGAMQLSGYLSVIPEAATAGKSDVGVMHNISEGGIYGALWEVAEASGVGLEIDLKKIPILQETVEICNFYNINPYKLVSGGALLMTADDGAILAETLEKEGIPATVIGKVTKGNDRLIINEDEKKFLTMPQVDEIYRVI